ncbi:protein FliT [Paenibacillus sophorae]|uniref:Flagellar protein FliT n=1 Tax=Paenibacillus sophorae TaxID=1333845 RepID=A0A1H8I6T2_9BACL|nr:flagellar protein FliT [Paenibacillus sophorae]QWU15863.1 flagellar protein FliT [Paenibacillus sophorae]SEN63982.1 protein FliT [Paenibacillus sophorae]
MNNLIGQLDQLTKGIISILHETSYEELESFVEERQRIVDAIGDEAVSCQPTSEQKQEIRRIMEHDSEILARMNTLRLEAQDWLQKRNQAKAQRSAYEAGYTPDSILMDRKK